METLANPSDTEIRDTRRITATTEVTNPLFNVVASDIPCGNIPCVSPNTTCKWPNLPPAGQAHCAERSSQSSLHPGKRSIYFNGADIF